MNKQQLLERASAHIFSSGLNDSGERLGLANMKYGLAKIHLAQEAFGLKPDATFITAPDVSITRNTHRWESGFGYGGLLTWGDGQQELIILDLKPNCCGMLVCGLEQVPAQKTLLQRIQALKKKELRIDTIPVHWDFGISNHFITLFNVTPLNESPFLPYALIIHGSGSELRGPNEWGDGLYWDLSEELQRKAEILQTKFGPLRLLTGKAAREYYSYHQRASAFSQKRRLMIAQRLLDDIHLYSNENHQGLASMNEMGLGIYLLRDPGAVLPITLQPRLPAYLVRARPNLSEAAIKHLGLEERAQRLGVYDRLRSANILPHGAGYTYPHIHDVISVIEIRQERYFELSLNNSDGRQIVRSVRNLPYAYRGEEVIDRVVELGLGDIVAQLDTIYSLKL